MKFKQKYHSDPYRSRYYAAQESFARALLESIVARNGLPFEVVSLGLTETRGVVPGYRSSLGNRFDYALVRSIDRAVVTLVEVTGDFEPDRSARFLVEKVEKAARLRTPLYFMYLKRGRVGTVRAVKWFYAGWLAEALQRCGSTAWCTVEHWLEGEKPYLVIPMKMGLTTQQFVAALKRIPREIGRAIPRITIDQLLTSTRWN